MSPEERLGQGFEPFLMGFSFMYGRVRRHHAEVPPQICIAMRVPEPSGECGTAGSHEVCLVLGDPGLQGNYLVDELFNLTILFGQRKHGLIGFVTIA